QFEKPTLEAKKSIWQSMLKHISNSEAEQLAKNYDFTGGQIENIVRKNAVESILKGETASFEKICEFCGQEKLDTGRNKIGFNV
ncbi:MAG: hypothetical protein LBR36_01230, partial [Bacteroidales bacterium]|nr:hypothetical protein [Bacteroidales bacterium]